MKRHLRIGLLLLIHIFLSQTFLSRKVWADGSPSPSSSPKAADQKADAHGKLASARSQLVVSQGAIGSATANSLPSLVETLNGQLDQYQQATKAYLQATGETAEVAETRARLERLDKEAGILEQIAKGPATKALAEALKTPDKGDDNAANEFAKSISQRGGAVIAEYEKAARDFQEKTGKPFTSSNSGAGSSGAVGNSVGSGSGAEGPGGGGGGGGGEEENQGGGGGQQNQQQGGGGGGGQASYSPSKSPDAKKEDMPKVDILASMKGIPVQSPIKEANILETIAKTTLASASPSPSPAGQAGASAQTEGSFLAKLMDKIGKFQVISPFKGHGGAAGKASLSGAQVAMLAGTDSSRSAASPAGPPAAGNNMARGIASSRLLKAADLGAGPTLPNVTRSPVARGIAGSTSQSKISNVPEIVLSTTPLSAVDVNNDGTTHSADLGAGAAQGSTPSVSGHKR